MEITTSLAGQGGAVFRRDGKPITTSKMVADLFGKQHKNVLRDIRNLIETDPELRSCFEPGLIPTPTGNGGTRMVPCYAINQRGATFLVLGFTGSKALKGKMEFLDAFDDLKDGELSCFP